MSMNPNTTTQAFSERELASLRQNVSMLRSQLKSGRIDLDFFNRQLEKFDDLLLKVQEDQRSRKKEGRFEALYNTSRLLGSSLDLQVVLDQIMDAIIQLTGAERGFLMLRDDDGGLTVKVARNFDQQTLDSDNFRFSRTIVNQVLDTGDPVVTTNAAEDPRFSQQASIVGQALRSIMATPLRVRGNIIGVAYVDNKIITGLFGEEDLAALDALMGQAAVALDNALLFAETDEALARRVEELRQLRRIDLLLNETLDADKAMQYTLEWACRLTNAAGGYMGLLEGDPPAARPRCSYGAVENGSLPETLNDLYPAVAQAAETGHSITADDNVLIVPLQREHRAFGVVVLHPPGDQPFTEEQQDLIERIIARAAVAIENGRLYAAVRAADKAKSEFVGVVAHDLKTPMTSIGGYASLMLMQKDNLEERQVQFLELIRNTVKRMEVLVSDLSDISRIESGHFFMNETQVSVPEIFQAVKDNTLPQLDARGHQFVEEVEPDLPDMWVDYYRLLQVLTNLVSNAYKYTPDGGTITLSARRAGDRIQFSVSDTGIGLSPEAIAKLGTKFWRAEDDFTRSQPGAGLGFAITRALVEQMGSHIEIDSEVGRGSTFTFSVAIHQS
ncbi:MAG TPA: GAF domain-containing protein [Spirillospora sp.]|nr:GAF domain-containing protein [Spirillospora sp.]